MLLTGIVLVGEPHACVWLDAVLFAPSGAEAIANGSTLFGTVELPDDNTAGGNQNAAILEIESGSHKTQVEQSTKTSNMQTNTISATVASEPASQSVPRKREGASSASTFHEALMNTAAKMTPNSLMHPTMPNTTTVPGSPQQPDMHDHVSRRRKRPADDEWNAEEAVARARRLSAPPPKRSRTAFDDGDDFLRAHRAAARRETERRLREFARAP